MRLADLDGPVSGDLGISHKYTLRSGEERPDLPPTGQAPDSWMIVLQSMPDTCCCPDLHWVAKLLGMRG